MILQGKGFFIWQIRFCENGDPNAIAALAHQAGLSHIVIKVADNAMAYNIDPYTGIDLVPPVAAALRSYEIAVWGWHFLYGRYPTQEADIAIRRIQELELDGYVLDVEGPYKHDGRRDAAVSFMNRLKSALGDYPLALSSYRYPSWHPQIPWDVFLEGCEINMPQFYWEGAHNPREQLLRCQSEFKTMPHVRPIIPTGAAYTEHGWRPTVEEVVDAMDTAQELGMSAINFWEWMNCRKNLPDVWDAIQDYQWGGSNNDQIIRELFDGLNEANISRILNLYREDAFHVTGAETARGLEAIRDWYDSLLNERFPGAKFFIQETNISGNSIKINWYAESDNGSISDGKDDLHLKDGKIEQHFSYFTITNHLKAQDIIHIPS